MPHLVDRNAIRQVDIDVPCDVPNCPYPVHWVKLREHYSYMDKMGLADAASQGVETMARYRFLKRLKEWNLVDARGKLLPITQATLSDLDEDTASAIWKAIDELDDAGRAEADLPNA